MINVEMHKYRVKEGGFGKHLAELGCAENDENYNPGMNIIHICLYFIY